MLPNDTFQLEVGFLASPPENPLRTEFIEEEATEVLVTEAQTDEELTEVSETTTDIQEETTKAEEETTVIAEESTTYPDEITETTVAESETEAETATEYTTSAETEEHTEISKIVADTQSEASAENISEIISDTDLTLEPITEEENETLDLIWSSSDEAVAAIGLNGLIYSRELGTATVTASTPDGVFTASCEVSVVEEIPEENSASVMPLDAAYQVALSPNTSWSAKPGHWAVKVSTEFTLNFDVYKCDSSGNYIGDEADISSLVNWQSSDSSVATVDIYGRVTGLKEGSTTITVSAKNGDNISVYNPIHVTVYTPYSSTRPGMAKAWVSQYKSTVIDCHTDRQAGVVSPGTLLNLLGTSGGYILGTIQGQTGQYFMWANNLYDQTNGTVTICKSGTASDTRRHWDMYTTQTVTLALTDGASATWTTSDSSIAKVSGAASYTGTTITINPVAEGTAYITANSGGKIDVIHVTVITRFYDENGIKENKIGITKVWCNNYKCSHTKCTILDRKDSITETNMMVTLYGESGGFYYAHPHGTNKYIYIWKSNVVLQDFNIHCKLDNRNVEENEKIYAPQGFAVGENQCYSVEVRGTLSAEEEHRLFRYDISTETRTEMTKSGTIGPLWHANDAAFVEFTENGINVPYLFVAAFSMSQPNYIVKLGFDGNKYYEVLRYSFSGSKNFSGITLLSGGGNQSAVFLLRDVNSNFYEVTIPNDSSSPNSNGLTYISLNLPSPKFSIDTEYIEGGAQSIHYDQTTKKLYLTYAAISGDNTNRIYVYEGIENASGALSFNDEYDINIYISDTVTSSYYYELDGIGFRPESKNDDRMWFLTFEETSGDSGIYTSTKYDRNGEKMVKNKIVVLLLCLTVAFLCSCTQSSSANNTSPNNTTSTEKKTPIITTTKNSTTDETTLPELSTVRIETNPNDLYSFFIKERYEKIYERQKQVAPEAFAEFDQYARNVYYFIYDIDGNGVDELIMGDWKKTTIDIEDPNPPKEIMVSGIYTIENGKVVEKVSSWWCDDYLWESSVLSNGLIRQKNGTEECPNILYFTFIDGSFSFMYGLMYYPPSANETIGKYKYFSDDEKAKWGVEITKEEFERLRDEANGDAEVIEINWKRIDEYGR